MQKACTAAQFEANPAGCPAASVIGHAKAITPLVPVPLEGPAYFVSHGGEAFPSLIVVLQGYGVKIDLVGTTFISKAGITSSTFKTVPDAPVRQLRTDVARGQVLCARGEREPLRKEARDAYGVRRAERREDQRVHEDRRHGVSEGEEEGQKEEGEGAWQERRQRQEVAVGAGR